MDSQDNTRVVSDFLSQWNEWLLPPETAELRYKVTDCSSYYLQELTPEALQELFEPMLKASDPSVHFNESIVPKLLNVEKIQGRGLELSDFHLRDGRFYLDGDRRAVHEGSGINVIDGETAIARGHNMSEVRIYAAANSPYRCPGWHDFVYVPSLHPSMLKFLSQEKGLARFAIVQGDPVPPELLAMVPGSIQMAGNPELCAIEADCETHGVRQYFDRHDGGSVIEYVFQDGFTLYGGNHLMPTLSVVARVDSSGFVGASRVVLLQECMFDEAGVDPSVFLVPCRPSDLIVDARLGEGMVNAFTPSAANASVLDARPAPPISSNAPIAEKSDGVILFFITIVVSALALYWLWHGIKARRSSQR